MEKTLSKDKKYYNYSNPHAHLEYNPNINNIMNEAEIKALQQIEFEKQRDELIKSRKKEFKKNCNEMILSYKEEQKIKNEEEELNKKAAIEEHNLKMKNFNKKVQERNTKKIINNNKNLIWIKKDKIKNENKNKIKDNDNKQIKIIKHFDENESIKLKKMNTNFIPKKTILKQFTNGDIKIEQEIQGNNNEINNDLFTPKKTILKSSDTLYENYKETERIENDNENIIDLRNNIEEIIYSQNVIKKNKSFNYKNSNIKNQINEKMNELKRFRYEGIFPEEKKVIQKKYKKNIIKNKKFLSEFEKKRFIKALKNIFTERLGEHNIYIQNICCCGNLQKQLTAIVEKGNLTVYALTEVECANNCIFYKNKKKYMKCINDVLDSIKSIKYENFHNKYKGIN